MIALKASQDGIAAPFNHLEVCGPDTVVAVAGPDEVAIVSEDVGSGLTRAMLGVLAVTETGEGGYEKLALFYILGCWDGDV